MIPSLIVFHHRIQNREKLSHDASMPARKERVLLSMRMDGWRTGRFYPSNDIADLWQAAGRGERIDEFRKLLGHEYLESTLMKHLKMPYVSPHPNAWIDPSDWTSMSTQKFFGAHDLSPNPWTGTMSERQFQMWKNFLDCE